MPPFGISTISPESLDDANPFMALVDAAASILEKNSRMSVSGIVDTETKPPMEAAARSVTPPVSGMSTSVPSSPSITSVTSVNTLETSSSSSSLSSPSSDKLSFADQIMVILDDESRYSDILTWMPDGKAFTIVDPKRFTKEHMPKLFHIRNMSSFVRKLSRWGFARAHEKETMNSDIFKHKDFQQGKYELCSKIKSVGRGMGVTTSAMPAISPSPIIKKTINSSCLSSQNFMGKPPKGLVPPPSYSHHQHFPQYRRSQHSQAAAAAAAMPVPSSSLLDSLRRHSDPLLDALAFQHIMAEHQKVALYAAHLNQQAAAGTWGAPAGYPAPRAPATLMRPY